MLKIGDVAPEFTLHDEAGKAHSLSAYRGKTVVVYFYPKDDTPGCTREAIGFTQLKSQFEAKNAVVLGVSKDSSESHQKFCDLYNLSITLLSDPDRAVIQAYGAWGEKVQYGKSTMGLIRSTFLVDPEGKVAKSWANVNVDGHPEAVLKAF